MEIYHSPKLYTSAPELKLQTHFSQNASRHNFHPINWNNFRKNYVGLHALCIPGNHIENDYNKSWAARDIAYDSSPLCNFSSLKIISLRELYNSKPLNNSTKFWDYNNIIISNVWLKTYYSQLTKLSTQSVARFGIYPVWSG